VRGRPSWWDPLGVVSIPGYILWFPLGFFLYATAHAGIAALVSRRPSITSGGKSD
jgi:hypothetical protein